MVLSGSHEANQYNIIIEQLSCLNLFTVSCDALENIRNFVFMAFFLHPAFQPFLLFCFLLRLENRHVICFFYIP